MRQRKLSALAGHVYSSKRNAYYDGCLSNRCRSCVAATVDGDDDGDVEGAFA